MIHYLCKSVKVTRLLLCIAQSRFIAAQYLGEKVGQTSLFFYSLFCNYFFPPLTRKSVSVKCGKTPSLPLIHFPYPTPPKITQIISFTKSLGDNSSLDLKRRYLYVFSWHRRSQKCPGWGKDKSFESSDRVNRKEQRSPSTVKSLWQDAPLLALA